VLTRIRYPLTLALLAATFATASAQDAKGRWEVQASGVEDDLFAVAFATDQDGVAVGANRTILRTTDGGQTWKRVLGPAKQKGNFAAVLFANDSIGWVRNQFTEEIHRTADGGQTWQYVKAPKEGSVYAPSGFASHAIAGETYFWQNAGGAFGGNGLYKTTDAGRTWTSLWQSDGKLGGGGVSLAFPDANEGWMASIGKAVPHEYYVARSSDGGKTWTAQQVKDKVGGNYMKLSAVDKDRGWFASHFSNHVHASADGGKTWTAHELGNGAENTIRELRFVDAQVGHVLCAGKGWHVRRTADGGKTWESLGSPAKAPDVVGMHFRSAGRGWVVGRKGYISQYQEGK
jgi:photosystem II stability/assembly factor-like uncharacterized protein